MAGGGFHPILFTLTRTFAAGAGVAPPPTLFTVTRAVAAAEFAEPLLFDRDRLLGVPGRELEDTTVFIAFGLVSTAIVFGAPGAGGAITSVGAGAWFIDNGTTKTG